MCFLHAWPLFAKSLALEKTQIHLFKVFQQIPYKNVLGQRRKLMEPVPSPRGSPSQPPPTVLSSLLPFSVF